MPADTHTATDQDQSKVRGTDVGPVTYTDYTHSEKPPGYSEERPVPSYKDSLAQPGGSQFPLRVLYADQEDPVGLPEYGDHRVKDIQIYEGIRKLIQTGPGDKIIQLIYDFDSQYFVPTTLDNPMDKAIIKINNFDDDGIRMQFLSSFLVYEGRGGLAVDIANTRLRLLNDGFNIGHQEGHLTEMTGVMILTDCIRAAILVNDVDSLRQFLQVNEVATDDGVTGSGQTRYFDFMEYLGFFLMCLQWRHYEAARLLRCCVSMNYPLEPAYLNVAEQAIHWFDHMGCPKLSTPLNFPELLSNFPKHLLGLPADYELSERSQHRDLYYTVIDPSPFSKLKASALGGHEPEVDLVEARARLRPASTPRLSDQASRVPLSDLVDSSPLTNRTDTTDTDTGTSTATATATSDTLRPFAPRPEWLIRLQRNRAERIRMNSRPTVPSSRPTPDIMPSISSGRVGSLINRFNSMSNN
ncbi:hypothetical protein BJ085DRAFT_36727 [Dimargaris cristalligena]|uniref:Uncharacterized protein n=1 Tax=Dimargaris cristalligena TaxID=215637 RepID=A0A4P9ZPY6_9FUNG|nr:hypothetical protein BJ085DRAFT_36727 [Dimargaris cristalligena]|eukprot:RKP34771.1 hypothetical protein BJ085DRAFT_36727 [Dimargaris cristalligena]